MCHGGERRRLRPSEMLILISLFYFHHMKASFVVFFFGAIIPRETVGGEGNRELLICLFGFGWCCTVIWSRTEKERNDDDGWR